MERTLPEKSLILVTGANGYIGSHICDQLLQAGYRVRGTVRDTTKTAWLDTYFGNKHGSNVFELVQVADITQPHCFDEVVKNVSAFACVASDLTMNPDPSISVTPIVNAVIHALDAAASEPSCKSFVLTSSSVATTTATPNKKFHIDTNSWNEEAIKAAFEEPHESTSSKRWAVYGASKALGEQAAWKYVRENKPHFTFNTILPNANFGPILDPQNQGGSAAGWIREIYMPGVFEILVKAVQPQWFVHTHDTVRLHVACLTDLNLNNERLLAFAEPFHWNQVLDMLRRITPDKELPADLEVDDRDLSTVSNERALEVLKTHYGQENWLTLEQGLNDLVRSIF